MSFAKHPEPFDYTSFHSGQAYPSGKGHPQLDFFPGPPLAIG
jgi:hypothetical protein